MNCVSSDIDRDEQAALWCLELASGDLPVRDQDAFDRWIADAENANAFEQVARVWQAANDVAGSPELIRLRSAAIENYRNANERRWIKPMSSGWGWTVSIAAAIALTFISLALLYEPVQHYETKVGERHVAILDDRSKLSLDADSRVEVALGRDRRAITLVRGRARFDVAKDSLRPFTVTVGEKMIVATGTSFSVERIDRQLRVLLYEGEVEVIDRAQPSAVAGATEAVLRPGNEFVAMIDTPAKALTRRADISRSASWESGQLSFDDEPMVLAVARMNRYSKTKLALADTRTSRQVVNGVFAAGDVEAFTEAVTALHPVAAERSPGLITLRTDPAR